MLDVRLLEVSFEPFAEMARFSRGLDCGGIASFLGQVRALGGAEQVHALELTHYDRLTLPGMREIGEEARKRWNLGAMLMLHRTGVLLPHDPIVLVAAAARHRRDAISAVDFVMDHLKSEAWFWKRERTDAGWTWVEPREQDREDLARWRSADLR